MSYTYAQWLTTVANLLVVDETDADFLQYAPTAIDYAEQRMYREADLLGTFTSSDAGAATIGNRNFTLPATVIVANGINVVTPAGTAPDSGVRTPLTQQSRDYMDAVWGSNSTGLRGQPRDFAMATNLAIILGPWPDAAYHLEIKNTFRPTALSASNTTTLLTTYMPAAWLACTMISWMGFQRDFGAQSDGSQDSSSWEKQYMAQMAPAIIEAFRQKALAVSATPFSASPALNTQRG